MNKIGKTAITLLGVAAIGLGGINAYAQTDNQLSQLDRNGLREIRTMGDRDMFREKMNNLGTRNHQRPNLNEEQREVMMELRQEGDHEVMREQLNKWGIDMQQNHMENMNKNHMFKDLTDDQREELQELRANGDRDVMHDKLMEFGVNMPERPNLSDEQREVMEEAHEMAMQGERETARTMIKELFSDVEDNSQGFFGFFKRMFHK